MKKGRLFTFGCSLTRYHYPTWSDIIGRHWEHYENWGETGAGNNYIFNSIIECDAKRHFDKNDTVIVLWSGIGRFDGYQFNHWVHIHHRFPDSSEFASCPDGYEIQSYAWMYAVEKLLESRCNYKGMTWVDYNTDSLAGKIYINTLNKLERIYTKSNKTQYNFLPKKQYIEYWQQLYSTMAGPDWPSLDDIYNKNINNLSIEIFNEIQDFYQRIDSDSRWKLESKIDTHPLPNDHLDIVTKHFPEIFVTPEIQKWVDKINQQLLAGKYVEFDNSAYIPKDKF